jgi:phosphatidylethanolamine/phosphatidyl-N-methylethanolamine N-methyltransferase
MKHNAKFFREFLTNPSQIGSVIPSSRFLERRILDAADLVDVHTVVELGPGTGNISRKIVHALPDSARLLTIELNARLAHLVNTIPDKRLISHHGSALDINDILAHYELGKADVVISGIPFSTMPHELGHGIVTAVLDALSPEGRFIAYQLRGKVAHLSNPVFGAVKPKLEIFNIPPMRVWRWDKA